MKPNHAWSGQARAYCDCGWNVEDHRALDVVAWAEHHHTHCPRAVRVEVIRVLAWDPIDDLIEPTGRLA